jgi:hypothetical protein
VFFLIDLNALFFFSSLSPRGDYRAPSDSEATVWLEEIKQVPEHDPD